MGLLVLSSLLTFIPQSSGAIEIREVLTAPGGRSRREVVRTDPVEYAIVQGQAVDTSAWTRVQAGEDGWMQGRSLQGAYAMAKVDSPTEQVLVLNAVGHSMVYVNGELRGGDPYGYGYLSLPVKLKKGENTFLFRVDRGRLKATLKAPLKPVAFDLQDATLPDLREGKKDPVWASITVLNATDQPVSNWTVEAKAGRETRRSSVATIPAMSARKINVLLPSSDIKPTIRLISGGKQQDLATLSLRRRGSKETYKRTFVSEIDGSVQYYAVNPAQTPGPGKAMILSLHGASVEAIGQADAYGGKSWAHIVCPTNRRPYGFDWEEIGRRDALEVFAHAAKDLEIDPQRVYLTGHSMGGHGTWQLGALFPDKWAAIAPSAGWISFATYGGGATYSDPSPIEKVLLRAGGTSDTLTMLKNYGHHSVYVWHGDADETVPVGQARQMRDVLQPWHTDFKLYEQPGAGHWWDGHDEPGADCVDWAGFFDLFSRRRRPLREEIRDIDFTTVNPGISASSGWLTVIQQETPLAASKTSGRFDPLLKRVSLKTENVRRLKIDLGTATVGSVVLDDQKLPLSAPVSSIEFLKRGNVWTQSTSVSPAEKNPNRNGPFKEALSNRFMIVYGSSPNDRNTARYLAETMMYRGNGSVEVMSDTAFDAAKEPNRNVLLIGNSKTNRAWASLLGNSSIQVEPGSVTIEGETTKADNLAVTFLLPRKGSDTALVAVMAATGAAGERLLTRTPLFTSGAAIPDLLVMSPEMLRDGTKGIQRAEIFDNNWRISK